jgi:hypothetical protein
MTTKVPPPITVEVKRSTRKVVIGFKDKPKKQPEKPDKASGWHIRMAISYSHKGATTNTYHVSMKEPEARKLAKVLLEKADEYHSLPPSQYD